MGRRVSIPFIAGQWSLPDQPARAGRASHVSIPFIAGQWSLPGGVDPAPRRIEKFQSPSLRGSGRFTSPCGPVIRPCMFQSPSLRGSGRFPWSPSSPRAITAGFNPLHCGAVVASTTTSHRTSRSGRVSIPFIAGQWSLPPHRRPRRRPRRVSIPFIAGQWSLLLTAPSRRTAGGQGFNPLHCGAVVASARAEAEERAQREVSIPFIAGQWSLPALLAAASAAWRARFNPLHCGAVVASRR